MGLDSVELVMEVEKVFDIEISNPEAEKIITVKDFHECILVNLKQEKTEEEVYAALVQILHEKLGVPLEEIKPHSKIVEDFGID